MAEDDIPDCLVSALKQCDLLVFPNIHTLLRIGSCLPVSSCECERSGSTLRRLNTYLRSTMSDERLTNLALIHTNYDKEYDLDEIVDTYSKLHSRRLELDSIIKPTDS